jgi:hypothetical protein
MQKPFEDSLVALANEEDWHILDRLDFYPQGHLIRFSDAVAERQRLAHAFKAKASSGELQQAISDRLLSAN